MFDFLNAADRAALYQAALIGSLLLACLWETIAPARAVSRQLLWRWCNNLLLAVFNHAVLLLVVPLAYAALVQWLAPALGWQPQAGLLPRLHMHTAADVVVVLLAIEVVGYGMHRLYHAVQLLWRMHAVHHSDTELDFSTAHRHHILESLLTALVTLPVLLVLQPSMVVLLVSQIITVVVVALSHANVTLGERLSRWLGWLVVTPDFHRLHHSSNVRFTNSHYGTVSPVFDYLLGTAHARKDYPPPDAELGLEYFRAPTMQRLDRLLLLPLVWRRRDGAAGKG